MAVSAFFHYITIITVYGLWPLMETFVLNLWPRIGLFVLWMAPGLDLISFLQGTHVTSEVIFGLWPHVGGLIEYLSNSSQTIRKYAIPVNF